VLKREFSLCGINLWLKGQYSISCRFRNVQDNLEWTFFGCLWAKCRCRAFILMGGTGWSEKLVESVVAFCTRF
jgi:hypothetical protein